MKFGVHLGPQGLEMDELRQAWHQIEELGFAWISVWDHFYPAAPPWEQPSFEATVVHTALAMETSRVRVGCLVYSAGYRHPAVMANVGVAIDHLTIPVRRAGLYAPGGRAKYPSTVLMCAVPARVAGTPRPVAICTQPSVGLLRSSIDFILRLSSFSRTRAISRPRMA